MKRVKKIIDWASDMNKSKKRFFPIFGICLGYEQLMVSLAKGDTSVLDHGFNDLRTYHPVKLNEENFLRSKLFGKLTLDRSKEVFSMSDAIRFYHFVSVKPETIVNHEILSKEINIIGTSRAENGKLFVAIAEHKSLPFYFVQFHPESNQFLRGTTMEYASKSTKVIKFLADMIFEFKNLSETQDRPHGLSHRFQKF